MKQYSREKKTNCFKFSKLETEIGEKRKMKSEINDWSSGWKICKSRNQHEITIRIKKNKIDYFERVGKITYCAGVHFFFIIVYSHACAHTHTHTYILGKYSNEKY